MRHLLRAKRPLLMAGEVACVLVMAFGFGLAWLPLGFIVGGGAVLFLLQGVES